MRLLYNILFTVFFVLSAPWYLWKLIRRGNWRGGFAQRVRAELDDAQLLRELAAADAEAAEALVAADASTGFELLGGGVLRCVLVRVDATEERQLLLLNVHHVAFDGASTGVLLGELGTLYRMLRSGGKPSDAPLPELIILKPELTACSQSWTPPSPSHRPSMGGEGGERSERDPLP